MTKIIVASTRSGLIGMDNSIPWKKPSDMKRFKALTMGGTLVMGRKTFDSMGRRHLPGRHSIVVSRTPQEGVETYSDIREALDAASKRGSQVWVIGGAEIYNLALPFVSEIDLTIVDVDVKPTDTAVYFNVPKEFHLESESLNPEDDSLTHCVYRRV